MFGVQFPVNVSLELEVEDFGAERSASIVIWPRFVGRERSLDDGLVRFIVDQKVSNDKIDLD
jgi:hypothetical protein